MERQQLRRKCDRKRSSKIRTIVHKKHCFVIGMQIKMRNFFFNKFFSFKFFLNLNILFLRHYRLFVVLYLFLCVEAKRRRHDY